MAQCRQCSKRLGLLEAVAGICSECTALNLSRSQALASEAQTTVAGEEVPEAKRPAQHVLISTETVAPLENCERLGMVSAVVIYGSHVGKDIMAIWRDAFGGRATSAEKLFNDAREACLDELRAKADAMQANQVIAVQLHYQDLTGNGKNMIMVTAHGTAVRWASS